MNTIRRVAVKSPSSIGSIGSSARSVRRSGVVESVARLDRRARDCFHHLHLDLPRRCLGLGPASGRACAGERRAARAGRLEEHRGRLASPATARGPRARARRAVTRSSGPGVGAQRRHQPGLRELRSAAQQRAAGRGQRQLGPPGIGRRRSGARRGRRRPGGSPRPTPSSGRSACGRRARAATRAGRSASCCSTNSCAPVIPSVSWTTDDDSRIAWVIRRSALTTAFRWSVRPERDSMGAHVSYSAPPGSAGDPAIGGVRKTPEVTGAHAGLPAARPRAPASARTSSSRRRSAATIALASSGRW